MTPRMVLADDRVDAVRGCVAVLRGSLVFCIEQADLPADVVLEQLRLDPTAPITVDNDPVRLRLPMLVRKQEPALYAAYSATAAAGDTPLTVTAIPYQWWANREPGAMRVWLPLA